MREILSEAEVEERTLFIFGIPDLWRKGARRMEGDFVPRLEKQILHVAGVKCWTLATFYPPNFANGREKEAVR